MADDTSTIPARPVIGGTNRNGGPITVYDQRDWDNAYGGLVNKGDENTPFQISGTAEEQQGAREGLGFAHRLYGQGLNEIGDEAADYSSKVKGRLNTDSARADLYRQGANRRIAQSAGKLGMAGATMGGAQEQAYRQSGMDASAMNQDYQDKALALYGRNISAKQQGTAGQYMAGKGIGQASTPGVTPTFDSGICCFIFLEARYGNGTMDSVVRMYRDEHMTDKNKRGYYKLSEVLVPMMRKYKTVKFLTRLLMTDPMYFYGKYHYGYGKIGVIFKPITKFWLKTFDYLGTDHKFIRENGEIC